MNDERSYPARPFLAVSAAIVRDGKILVVRRARMPALGLYTFPGGVVEVGETLHQAAIRETCEETGIQIAPVTLAGHREWIKRDAAGKAERHFVIMSFASRWVSGEFQPSDELAAGEWRVPADLAALKTTDGLTEIAVKALALLSG